jgi:hypothetical protein
MKALFKYLSAFNFNIDLAAPECTIQFTYDVKWFFIEGLPLGAMAIFVTLHLIKVVHKRIIKGRRKKLNSHVGALVGLSLMMFYYLYLYLTRSIIDIFNCAPVSPPERDMDGNEVTYLQVVPERCWQPGGIHLKLLPWAAIAFMLYCIGFPAVLAFIFWRWRKEIQADQILRVAGTGTSRKTNEYYWDVRKRFHKLYYQFKPRTHYWLLVILARKFGLAFVSLMFRKNPTFQLALALLVMFWAYAMQASL